MKNLTRNVFAYIFFFYFLLIYDKFWYVCSISAAPSDYTFASGNCKQENDPICIKLYGVVYWRNFPISLQNSAWGQNSAL